jgi:hypothetical protein
MQENAEKFPIDSTRRVKLSNSFTASVNLATSPSSMEAARSCHANFSSVQVREKNVYVPVSGQLALTAFSRLHLRWLMSKKSNHDIQLENCVIQANIV